MPSKAKKPEKPDQGKKPPKGKTKAPERKGKRDSVGTLRTKSGSPLKPVTGRGPRPYGKRTMSDYDKETQEMLGRGQLGEFSDDLATIERVLDGKEVVPAAELSRMMSEVASMYAHLHAVEREMYEKTHEETPAAPTKVDAFMSRARKLAGRSGDFAAAILGFHSDGAPIEADHAYVFVTPSKAVSGKVGGKGGVEAHRTLQAALDSESGRRLLRRASSLGKDMSKRLDPVYWGGLEKARSKVKKAMEHGLPPLEHE